MSRSTSARSAARSGGLPQRLLPVRLGAGGEGEGQVVEGHRGAADRDLVQDRGLARG